MRAFRLSSAAEQDFAGIIDWYRHAAPNQLERFQHDLNSTLIAIRENPLAWSLYWKDLRSRNLERFPYRVLYQVADDEVVVLAITHHARDTNAWTDRVNEEPATYGKEAVIMESTAPQLREALYQAGLCLPEEERIALAEELLQSTGPNDLSQEWTAELDRRSRAVKEGTMACITLEELKLKYGRA